MGHTWPRGFDLFSRGRVAAQWLGPRRLDRHPRYVYITVNAIIVSTGQ
jgi:hypothetical protein